MNIPLNQFEIFIEERILNRGLSYFKNGAIIYLSEISTGEYTVQIEISKIVLPNKMKSLN